MANLMGDDAGTALGRAGVVGALAVPETALHLYGKAEARSGRKMGHVTSLGATPAEALERVLAARASITATE
jgi:5-(carboxyamino)imidazole ribonucleotide synthase